MTPNQAREMIGLERLDIDEWDAFSNTKLLYEQAIQAMRRYEEV